jgi:hypothetical protein
LQVYFVRHGETDYDVVASRGVRGWATSFAPLSHLGRLQIDAIARDYRLQEAEAILCSSYARALESGALLSRALNKPLFVEYDLHEWLPQKDPLGDIDAELLRRARSRPRVRADDAPWERRRRGPRAGVAGPRALPRSAERRRGHARGRDPVGHRHAARRSTTPRSSSSPGRGPDDGRPAAVRDAAPSSSADERAPTVLAPAPAQRQAAGRHQRHAHRPDVAGRGGVQRPAQRRPGEGEQSACARGPRRCSSARRGRTGGRRTGRAAPPTVRRGRASARARRAPARARAGSRCRCQSDSRRARRRQLGAPPGDGAAPGAGWRGPAGRGAAPPAAGRR